MKMEVGLLGYMVAPWIDIVPNLYLNAPILKSYDKNIYGLTLPSMGLKHATAWVICYRPICVTKST